jgi:hypothetical protein
MRWILLILVFALTWGLFYAIPYLAEIGWTLMSWTGWTLLPGALIVAYIGFVGPLWGKALRPFRSNPDVPLFPPRPGRGAGGK